ncbi:MAG TPA: hypothetical protein VD926_06665 [Acidimicrobiales bacterium]|nr:hypothetical protein [Acidimicrobiales bacterium]
MNVGVGAAVITPPNLPVRLAGFAEEQVAHEVRDDLEVRALYLEGDAPSGGRTAVCLLVYDLLGMSRHFADPIRVAVGAALGLERAAVLTSCVHTHAAPSTMAGTEALGWPTPEGYAELLVERSVQAATEAQASAVAASLRYGRWPLPGGLSINRRGHPYDPTFAVLDVRAADDAARRITSLANVSIHPVALGPECVAVSSDWVGAFRGELTRRAGGTPVLLSGALGDVNPHHVHRQGNECTNDLFAEADEIGSDVAEAVDDVLARAEDLGAVAGPAVERWREVEVPTERTALARGRGERPLRVELVEWSLGPVRLVSVPGEAFHALGRSIEEDSGRGGKVLVAGLSPVWQGYLPMPFTEGYEEETSYGRAFVATVAAALSGATPRV